MSRRAILFLILHVLIPAESQAMLSIRIPQGLDSPGLVDRVQPAVVTIWGETATGSGNGSGFVVSGDGTIVTNLHVVQDLETARVVLSNGEQFDRVRVLAFDRRRDLAVVKVSGFNLDALALGDSDAVHVGETVLAFGSPKGLAGTVSKGIVSAVRPIQEVLATEEGYSVLQTDAAVNPGNSGGPLVNERGEVVGVVTLKRTDAESIGYAVPINYVRGLLADVGEPKTLDAFRAELASVSEPRTRLSMTEQVNVLVYRKKARAGSALEPRVYCNGLPLVSMDNGRYFGLALAPGVYKIEVGESQWPGVPPTNVQFIVEAGGFYFVRFDGGLSYSLRLTTREDAAKEMKNLKPVQEEYVLAPNAVHLDGVWPPPEIHDDKE